MNDFDATLPPSPQEETPEADPMKGDTANISYYHRGLGLLLAEEFDKALQCFELAIETDPNDANAYLGALLCTMRYKNLEMLADTNKDFTSSRYWQEGCRLANPKLKKELQDILRRREAYVHYYRAHSILTTAKKPQDYLDAAYSASVTLRIRPDDKDAADILVSCRDKYLRLTGHSMALADDLRPDHEHLRGDFTLTRSPSLPLFEEDAAAKKPGRSDAQPKPAAQRTPAVLNTDPNGVEYRPDVDTVYQSKEEKEAEQLEKQTAEQLALKRKHKKNMIRAAVILLAVVVVGGGLYYGLNFRNISRNRAYDQLEVGNYERALELMTTAMGGDTVVRSPEEDAFIDECYYGMAVDRLDQGDLNAAADFFKQAGQYADAVTRYRECHYQLGEDAMANAEYFRAVDHFEEIIGYEDAYARCYEAKYQYILANYETSDQNTKRYLEDLSYVGYEDTVQRYKELFGWRLENIITNSSKDDYTTNQDRFAAGQSIFFHFTIEGGPAGEQLLLYTKTTKPDGSVVDYTFESAWPAGQRCWFGWADGVSLTQSGEMLVEFYDQDGRLLEAYPVYVEK